MAGSEAWSPGCSPDVDKVPVSMWLPDSSGQRRQEGTNIETGETGCRTRIDTMASIDADMGGAVKVATQNETG